MKINTAYREDKSKGVYETGIDEEMCSLLNGLIALTLGGEIDLYSRWGDTIIYGLIPALGHEVTLANDKHGRRLWLHHRFQLWIGEDTVMPIWIYSIDQLKVFEELWKLWEEKATKIEDSNSAVYDEIMEYHQRWKLW